MTSDTGSTRVAKLIGRRYTLDGIRRPLKAPRERIALEDEVAAELEANGFS